jgi:TonB family protein
MIHRLALFIALSFFALAFRTMEAQAPDAPKRNCTPPRVTHQEDPPLSHRFGTTAVATLSVTVDENGRVTDASILTSSGDDKFDDGTLKTIRKWKFKPCLCNGKPTPIRFKVEMH